MGTINYLQIDFLGPFAKEVRNTHFQLVTKIEEIIGRELPPPNGRHIKIGNNLAYLSFKGLANDEEFNHVLWAHSGINGKSRKLAEFNELFNIYYCMPSEHPRIPSGLVNEKNDTLTYIEVENDFNGDAIYNRNNDSESKLIERFLELVGDRELCGELFIYTTLGPCLSCEKKLTELVTKFFADYEKLNVNVWYCTDYSNKNFVLKEGI